MAERTALILSGGIALGAYSAGACALLLERGQLPARIAASSIGAINAAILAGNPPERRMDALRRFWEVTAGRAADWTVPAVGAFRQLHSRISAIQTLAFGLPRLFLPRLPGVFSAIPGMAEDAALYDLTPLRHRLAECIDVARLNDGTIHLTVCATDVHTGEEVRFDTAEQPITVEHILASSAFIPAFAPVEVDGRLLCDGGFSANLPLDAVLDEPAVEDRLCLAVDLFSPRGDRPHSVAQAAERLIELLLGNQTRLAIEGQRRLHEQRARAGERVPAVRFLHLVYRAAAHENVMKGLDFSSATVAERWEAGHRDMARALSSLPPAAPGAFTVHTVEGRIDSPAAPVAPA